MTHSVPPVPFPPADVETSVAARFRKVARAVPDHLALSDGQTELSFAALDAASDDVARAMAGMDRSRPVSLVFAQGIDSVVAFLGGLKAGVIVMPVDPFAAPEGTEVALSRTQAIVTQARFRDWCRDKAAKVPLLTDWRAATGPIPPEPGPRDPAVIYLTSATTGLTKGVLHDQRNLTIIGFQKSQRLPIGPGDRASVTSSFAHIMTGVFILGALLNGAAIELYDLRGQGALGMVPWLRRRGITALQLAVPVLRQLIQMLIDSGSDWHPRQVTFGGDAIVPGDIDKMRNRLGWSGPLINMMGSAEAGPISCGPVDPDQPRDADVVPIGLPFDNQRVMILDEDGSLLPTGELGEIAVSGSFVSYGYWDAPDRTAERFSRDPDDPDRRVFRTGDLGRLRQDGQIELHGRKDHYVKIRGIGFMLPAVEAAMHRLPGVAEAVVAPSRDAQGTMRLTGYVVLAPGARQSPLDLRQALGADLPNFMVPWKIVIMDAIPTTAGGKVARRDLPMPGQEREAWMPPYVAPLPGAEEDLAALWRAVLRIDRIGRDDDFFHLGGDSLDLAGIASGFGQRRGLDAGDADLFAETTLRGMAETLMAEGIAVR